MIDFINPDEAVTSIITGTLGQTKEKQIYFGNDEQREYNRKREELIGQHFVNGYMKRYGIRLPSHLVMPREKYRDIYNWHGARKHMHDLIFCEQGLGLLHVEISNIMDDSIDSARLSAQREITRWVNSINPSLSFAVFIPKHFKFEYRKVIRLLEEAAKTSAVDYKVYEVLSRQVQDESLKSMKAIRLSDSPHRLIMRSKFHSTKTLREIMKERIEEKESKNYPVPKEAMVLLLDDKAHRYTPKDFLVHYRELALRSQGSRFNEIFIYVTIQSGSDGNEEKFLLLPIKTKYDAEPRTLLRLKPQPFLHEDAGILKPDAISDLNSLAPIFPHWGDHLKHDLLWKLEHEPDY